jgi:pimeloyl-ACP methyl ester carboxylesterase
MPFLESESRRQLYYEMIDGLPGLPYLVFLHEGLGCSAMWRDFPQRLCERTGCPGLCYDRLGYGRSAPFAGQRTIHYLHRAALIELPAVLNRLIPENGYFLIGHSDGGSIALIHSAEQPPLLRGIATEAAHVFVEERTLAGIREAVEAFTAGRLDGLHRYHGEKTGPVFSAWADTWLSPAFRHWNLEYLLPSISCPVLAIQGVDDQYGTAAQIEAILAGAASASQEMVADCGHVPHREQPARVIELMAEFIGNQG